MHFWTLLLLGSITGGTILLGLPIARLRGFSATLRASLSMLAAGILVFLLVEILGEASGQTSVALQAALLGSGSGNLAALLVLLLLGGFLAGFVGLVAIEHKVIRPSAGLDPRRLSLMIAVGIGLHNLSEGLAIGQAFIQGMHGLTIGLVIGFALHNATEGFGIVGPMVRNGEQVGWRRIFQLAAIGGGPTFVGTLLGGIWTSTALSVLVLAMAGGALLYVLKELFSAARRETAQVAIMIALVVGFGIGWGTEVIAGVAQNHAHGGTMQAGAGMTEADGDMIMQPSAIAGPPLSHAQSAQQDEIVNAELHEQPLAPTLLPDGTKRFNLTASVFAWQLYPGAKVSAWGFDRQVPGPLIRVKVGDKVEFVVKNNLPQATTVHWHGLAVPEAQDGVPGVTQAPIAPGATFIYHFTITRQMIGTHFYHTHVNDDFQMDHGLHGVFIVDPAPSAGGPHYDIDALYEIGSFKIGGTDSENVFTLDGKAYPEAPVLTVPEGAHVLLRIVNASAEETHVMHLHGYTFRIVARDGNRLAQPVAASTIMLGPSQTADIAFIASNPGKWMFHCHILDHTINPGPNGEGSATRIPAMGGLVTFIDVVRPGLVRHGYVAAGSLMRNMPMSVPTASTAG